MNKNPMLKKEDKEAILNNIVNYMEKNPVRNDIADRHIFQKGNFLPNFYILIQNKMRALFLKPMGAVASVLVLVMAVSGTTFAAENSLPGDLLYPVKIHVNETFRSMIAFSDESQAELNQELLDERLAELEELVEAGELDEKTSGKIEKRLEKYFEKALSDVEELEEEGEEETASELNAGLKNKIEVHERILDKMTEKGHPRVEHIQEVFAKMHDDTEVNPGKKDDEIEEDETEVEEDDEEEVEEEDESEEDKEENEEEDDEVSKTKNKGKRE